MTQFHANYLQDNWEASTHCELLSMTQGSSSFWDFAIKLQSKTSLLLGTPSHLAQDKLCHQSEVGMGIGGETIEEV